MKTSNFKGPSRLLRRPWIDVYPFPICFILVSKGWIFARVDFWILSSFSGLLYANSFNELNHYAIGGVRAQALSVFVLSTSTTGSSRRVPPPRGSRLAVPARDTPFAFLKVVRWLRTRRFHVR